MEISLKKKISIVGLGVISTLLILLMIETVFAQLISDFLIGHISDNLILFIIIFGLFVLSIVISVIVSFIVVGDIHYKSIRNTFILSLSCLLLFLFVVCNISLFLRYNYIYGNLYGFDILWVFPQVLVYFGIYILNDVFNLFIFVIVVYYLFFIIFLEKMYQMKEIEIKER